MTRFSRIILKAPLLELFITIVMKLEVFMTNVKETRHSEILSVRGGRRVIEGDRGRSRTIEENPQGGQKYKSSKKIQRVPKVSKKFQKFRKKFQKVPKVSKVPKRFQKSPKEPPIRSKRSQNHKNYKTTLDELQIATSNQK